jgi:hypothetical protein
MTYKEALIKELSQLFDKVQDIRMKGMFALLKQQLNTISEEQAQQIVITATKVIKKIEANVKPALKINDKVSSSTKG